MEVLSGKLVGELLSATPRPLIESKGELIFLDDQYVFSWRDENKRQHYKLLSPSTLRQAFCNEVLDSGWISAGIVRCGTNAMGDWAVKFIAPGKFELDLGDRQTQNIHLPGLVFFGTGKEYYVWATDSSAFDPMATAFYAPLPNVNSSGRICFGNNTPPNANGRSLTDAWELFIRSPFNGDLANGKSKRYPNDVRQQLRSVAKRRLDQYPTKDLVFYRHSVTNCVEQITDRG